MSGIIKSPFEFAIFLVFGMCILRGTGYGRTSQDSAHKGWDRGYMHSVIELSLHCSG